jgi:hypothetical protein
MSRFVQFRMGMRVYEKKPPRASSRSKFRARHKSSRRGRRNSRHAMDMAQKLSHQLRAAEDRIAELEVEVAAHQFNHVTAALMLELGVALFVNSV